MATSAPFTARTCVYWQNFSWTTRRSIMMWSRFSSMCWHKTMSRAATWLATSPRWVHLNPCSRLIGRCCWAGSVLLSGQLSLSHRYCGQWEVCVLNKTKKSLHQNKIWYRGKKLNFVLCVNYGNYTFVCFSLLCIILFWFCRWWEAMQGILQEAEIRGWQ